MDEDVLSKRKLLLLSVTIVVIFLMVSSVFLTSFLTQEDSGNDGTEEEDKTDWTNYPYVIPGTDMEFPDEEGLYPKGETWISLGLRLDFEAPDKERTYINFLYHEYYKDVFVSNSEETVNYRLQGKRQLSIGKMNMSFNNLELPRDILKFQEGESFQYDLKAFFKSEDKITYELDLELISKKPPATMFDGEVQIDSDYYRLHALTRCEVNGEVKIGSDNYEVSGLGWIENQRGSFKGMKWDWFAFWDDSNIEMEIVNLSSSGKNIRYAMHVAKDGELKTIDDLNIEVTSSKNGFGYSWEISSDQYDVDLNVTCIKDRMVYSMSFAAGFGRAKGTVRGKSIDTITYIELKSD
ncbi:MAG: hypothetical protein KGY76_06710 [Candidatus Thermoplasmatota archaeon]|nr:hypothetical protein [Candidatus Thermoplasmatota archaeon]